MRCIKKMSAFIDVLFNSDCIKLSIDELHELLGKNLKKQDIINLLYKYNGVEIYDIAKYKKKGYNLLNNLMFYFIIKDNIKITYSYPLILFNGVPMSDYIQYQILQHELSILQVISLYKSLNNMKIKKTNNRLIFSSKFNHYNFAIEICNAISKNNNIFKKIYNNKKKQIQSQIEFCFT